MKRAMGWSGPLLVAAAPGLSFLKLRAPILNSIIDL